MSRELIRESIQKLEEASVILNSLRKKEKVPVGNYPYYKVKNVINDLKKVIE